MNTLFTVGCSFTEGFSVNSVSESYLEYKEFSGGEFPKSWPTILAKKLNFNLKNYGEGASGNEQIFNQFCKKCREIKKDDFVIIEWSFPERYRVACDNENWLKLGPGKIFENAPILSETHNEIILNRTLKPHIDLIYDQENIVDFLSELIGFQVFYWSVTEKIIYNLPLEKRNQKKYLLYDRLEKLMTPFNLVHEMGGLRIHEETNNKIMDHHMGGSGHKVQAELFYEHIIKFKNYEV